MALTLTDDQLTQLKSLGIDPTGTPNTISESTTSTSQPVDNISKEVKTPQESAPTTGQIQQQTISSSSTSSLLKQSNNPIVPLLSISGLTFLTFGGLILFKSKATASIPSVSDHQSPITDNLPSPTQVPKSIQHYLLTSQQFFTKAVEAQSTKDPEAVNYLNQSILTASQAIKEFPSDSRAFEQRGRIYTSLIDSQPQLLTMAISDLSAASRLNPESAEITRTLATLYAKKGDAQNTLTYLTQTVNLEPTKAQNFYDLARLQQQAGFLPEAVATYDRLLTIIADPVQKTQVIAEKDAISKLISQAPKSNTPTPITDHRSPITPSTEDGPLLQADSGTGLIIAAPETAKDITVNNLSNSNSLSGSDILVSNTPSITITNSNVTSTSQVYLTVTKGGKNQNLQVLSKSTGSFVVGLDTPISEDIEFKWWIVN